MQWTAWISLALGLVTVVGTKIGPPPVMVNLGPLVPTPGPTPRKADKMRLITTITVQNSEEGESVVSFEATDFSDEGPNHIHMIASKRYSLAEEKPETKQLSAKIMNQIRALERDMLEYAEKAGPPKVRAPMSESGGGRPAR